mmetsp:Transcript_40536/g.78917  ORF Transcript_40536/g.78917 Transcript_40536/m.78917 type:complete len:258 (+) Transcript_40536:931-1704(+)
MFRAKVQFWASKEDWPLNVTPLPPPNMDSMPMTVTLRNRSRELISNWMSPTWEARLCCMVVSVTVRDAESVIHAKLLVWRARSLRKTVSPSITVTEFFERLANAAVCAVQSVMVLWDTIKRAPVKASTSPPVSAKNPLRVAFLTLSLPPRINAKPPLTAEKLVRAVFVIVADESRRMYNPPPDACEMTSLKSESRIKSTPPRSTTAIPPKPVARKRFAVTLVRLTSALAEMYRKEASTVRKLRIIALSIVMVENSST